MRPGRPGNPAGRRRRRQRSGSPGRGGEAGSILLPVLVLLLLVATAATAMTIQAQTSLREASTRRTRLTLGVLSDASVRAVALALAEATAARAAPPFAIDGTPETCGVPGRGQLTIAVQDEGGRLDINKASPDLLLRVLSHAGLSGWDAKAATTAITNRRDPHGQPPSGRKALGSPNAVVTQPKDFASADELDGLAGVPPDSVARILPLFTVANGSAGIDPTVAAPALRAVIPRKEMLSPAFEPFTTTSDHSDFVITATLGPVSGPRVRRQAGFHLDPEAGPLGHFTSWEAPPALGDPDEGRPGTFCTRIVAALLAR